jgi:signal transduction histidine kinase
MSRRDLMWVIVGTGLFWAGSIALELSEHLHAWLKPWERYQVDELPGVFLFLALALAWYAWRRVAEAREQLALRRSAEARLESTLADNRRLSLSHVELQEGERRVLARELHDELGQHLNALKIDAVALRDWTENQSEDMHGAALAVVDGVNHVHDTLRGLLQRLRPVGLDELGLAAALEHLVDSWRARHAQSTITLAIEGDIDHLAENENITCYRLVQEALTNVAKHAAASEVGIAVSGAGRVMLTVRDNGVGAAKIEPASGLGLVGMRERVEALGGEISFDTRPGAGFTVRASFPVKAQTHG